MDSRLLVIDRLCRGSGYADGVGVGAGQLCPGGRDVGIVRGVSSQARMSGLGW